MWLKMRAIVNSIAVFPTWSIVPISILAFLIDECYLIASS